ncbi:MAG: Asp-tRNA(Asn)/Glu-tRNA(Gln) amidotransferase subunit GatC [Alphaproteobacteria bacterium]|nr:Asp-tRNA(Asn)/Glu-tRNA(Gln) amidotransferase subunit GatC [Alphaproteobacteria bacterium]
MAIDTQTVKRIAFLSRLKVDDDKVEATSREFDKIISWVDQLKEVDTDNVEPLISVNENHLTLRQDEVTEGNQAEAVLANAPMKEYGYFAVPKVVE